MNGLVSVVTICYNAENEIERTLKSVYQQNFQYFEYIVKDGGSTDKTNEIVKKYIPIFEKRGIKLKHVIEKDHGIYDAMNHAVSKCNHNWVIYMNAGDSFYSDTVLSDVFCNSSHSLDEADVIYGHTLFLLNKNKGLIVNHDSEQLEYGWSLCHQSVFVKRELLLSNPFDCQYRIVADYDQMLKLKRSNCRFLCVNSIISAVDREGLSNVAIKMRYDENNKLIQKYNLPRKNKGMVLGYVKQLLRKAFPWLEEYFFVKNSMKRVNYYKR